MTSQETEVFHKLRVATPLSSRTGNPVSVVFNGVSANSWLSPIGISNNRKSDDKGEQLVLPQRPQSTGSIAIIRHHPRPSGLKRNETIVGRHLSCKFEEIDIHSIEGQSVGEAFRRPVPFEGNYREDVESLLYKQRLVKKGYRGGGFCDGLSRKPRPYTIKPCQFRSVEHPINLELTVKSLELSREKPLCVNKRKPLLDEESERKELQCNAFRDISRTCMRRAQSAPPASRQNPSKQKRSLYWRARSAYHRKLMTPNPESEYDPGENSQIIRGSMLRPLMYNASCDIQHSTGCPYKCKGCFKACLVSADYLENARNRQQPVKSKRDFRYRSLMKKDPRFILHQALARNQPIYKLVHGYCDERSVNEAWDDGAPMRGNTDESDNLTQLSGVGDKVTSTIEGTRDELTLEDDGTSQEDEYVDAKFLQPQILRTCDSKPSYRPIISPKEYSCFRQEGQAKRKMFSRDGVKSAEERRPESLDRPNARSKSFSETETNSKINFKFISAFNDRSHEDCVFAVTSKREMFENRTIGDHLKEGSDCIYIEERENDLESRYDNISDVDSAIMDVSRLFRSPISSSDNDMKIHEHDYTRSSSEGDRNSDTGSDDSQETIQGHSGQSGGSISAESGTGCNSAESQSDSTVHSDSSNSKATLVRHRRNRRNRGVSSINGAQRDATSTSECVSSGSISGSSVSSVDVSDENTDEPDTDSTIPKRKRKSTSKYVARKVERGTKRKPSKEIQSRKKSETSKKHNSDGKGSVTKGVKSDKRNLASIPLVDSSVTSDAVRSGSEVELEISEHNHKELEHGGSSDGDTNTSDQDECTPDANASTAKVFSKRTRRYVATKNKNRKPKSHRGKGKISKPDESGSDGSPSEETSSEDGEESDSKGDENSDDDVPNRKTRSNEQERQLSRTTSEETNSENMISESAEHSGDDTSDQNQDRHDAEGDNTRKKELTSKKYRNVKKQTNKNQMSRKGVAIPTNRQNKKGKTHTKEEAKETDEEISDSDDDDEEEEEEEEEDEDDNDNDDDDRVKEMNGVNDKSQNKLNNKSKGTINTDGNVRGARTDVKRGKLERHKKLEDNSQSNSIQSEEDTSEDVSECSSSVSRGDHSHEKRASDEPETRDTADESGPDEPSGGDEDTSETMDEGSKAEHSVSEATSNEETSDDESESEGESDDD